MRNCKRRSSRPKSTAKHQHEVGTGYFDDVAQVIAVGLSSTAALRASTEHEQFH
jgi:isocitrate lyase